MPILDRRRIAILLGVAVPSLVLATLAIALLRSLADVPNASIIYLAAVVATAIAAGAPGAVAATIVSILLYDWFFVEPYYTLTMNEPSEWLNAVLLLAVGLIVGQLAALQRSRAEDARAREREARALFRVSRELATRGSAVDVLPTIARIIRDETAMLRVWIALGPESQERVAADTENGSRAVVPSVQHVLRRNPGDEPAAWVRIHVPGSARGATAEGDSYRVRIEAAGAPLGSLWAVRARGAGPPDRNETRLLAATADQAGQALAHDRLAAEASAAAIARESDALKSALLQSVSHDLRTPLATIRAAAGSLRPGNGLSAADQLESAEAIDREVEYLNRLVTNLLDLSRIEAGALRAECDVFELDDIVGRTLDRLRSRLSGRPLELALAGPLVDVDPVFLDEAVTNALENAIKYTPLGTVIRLSAHREPDSRWVRLTIEDAGRGVPAKDLPRLFEKFYRVPGSAGGSRSGTGIGLAVVKGLVEAMEGHVEARRSALGGLAIDIDLVAAEEPAPAPAPEPASGPS